MGCVQQKNNSQVVLYEASMGAPLASITGKDIQANQTVVMGVSEDNQEKIFSFDAITQRFKGLTVPLGMKIWNYSSIVHLSDKEVMVTGGLSGNASEISSEAYIYDSGLGKAIRLPNLTCTRYTHMSIFHKGKLYAIGGRDYGEDDDQAIRTHCERFNFQMHRWEKIARLNIPRCTGFTFLYKDAIHVCGGLTGKMHRSRAIERYDESNDQWVVLDFKLSRGIECGSLISGLHFLPPAQAKDKLFIVGGNTEEGAQDTVFVINLAEQTVISSLPLVHPRVLQKSVSFNSKVYVFGGSETDGIEYYDQSAGLWREDTTQSFIGFVNPENIDFFSSSQPPITIPDVIKVLPKSSHSSVSQGIQSQGSYVPNVLVQSQMTRNSANTNNNLSQDQPDQRDVELSVSRPEAISNASDTDELSVITKAKIKEDVLINKAYLFGTDVDPFILEIDFLNAKVQRKSVPLKMRLFQHQSVVSIEIKGSNENNKEVFVNDYYVLMGGVQEGMIKTVRYTYIFDPVTFTAKRVEDMLFASYAFASIVDEQYVYAIGGKQSHRDDQNGSLSIQNNNSNNRSSLESSGNSNSNSLVGNSVILPQCQRFNYLTNKWERVSDLNVKRVSAMCVKINGKLYVFGGFKGESEQVRPNEIEVLDPSKESPAWQLLNVRFPIGLEGAAMLQLPNDELLLFGGRTSQGEIKYISKFTMTFATNEVQSQGSEERTQDKEDNSNQEQKQETELNHKINNNLRNSSVSGVKLEKVNQMLQSRCLHKVCLPYRNFALILGGQLEPLVETVNISDNYSSQVLSNQQHIDLMVYKINLALKRLRDTSLKQYSFASL